ncbi:hypothetical protein RvY_05995 [Ramazzottius varieornatus]|uniref:Uncharacterized protein n=1 Tax=Ramazzottius varieornatus TaxID=947166 RepID=A0A1D1UZZ2_RAMVA|nr:hypothetical protein RvY_05995 [Ramazzottius varieornatus]
MPRLYTEGTCRWKNYGSGMTDSVTAAMRALCLLVLSSNAISAFPPSRTSMRRDIAYGNVFSRPLSIDPGASSSTDIPAARQILNFNPTTTANITVNGQTIFLTPAQQQLLITLLTNVLVNDTVTITTAPPTTNLTLLSPILADIFANTNYGLRLGDYLGTTGLASQAAQSFINPFSAAANSNPFTSVFGLGNTNTLGSFGLGSPGAHLFRPSSNGQLLNNNDLVSLLQASNGLSGLPSGFQSAGSSSGFSGSSLQTVLNPNSLASLGSLIPGSQLDGINVGSSTDLMANGFARIAQPSNNGGSVMFRSVNN